MSQCLNQPNVGNDLSFTRQQRSMTCNRQTVEAQRGSLSQKNAEKRERRGVASSHWRRVQETVYAPRESIEDPARAN